MVWILILQGGESSPSRISNDDGPPLKNFVEGLKTLDVEGKENNVEFLIGDSLYVPRLLLNLLGKETLKWKVGLENLRM